MMCLKLEFKASVHSNNKLYVINSSHSLRHETESIKLLFVTPNSPEGLWENKLLDTKGLIEQRNTTTEKHFASLTSYCVTGCFCIVSFFVSVIIMHLFLSKLESGNVMCLW